MESESPKHVAQNRRVARSKLRRGGKHCPVCLVALPKVATKTRLKRKCTACAAQPVDLGHCMKCGAEAVWVGPAGAACQSCGTHGAKGLILTR